MKVAMISAMIGVIMSLPSAHAQTTEKVTVDNFCRAESDNYLKGRLKDGYFGKLVPLRDPVNVKHQGVVRANFDTLFSYGVFDLTSPVTITLPDSGKRYQALRVIDEDHYIVVDTTKAGTYTFTQESVGTRYVHVAVRTLANPKDAADMKAAHDMQDQVIVKQADPGKLELPDWNLDELAGLRKVILQMGPYVPDSKGMFGPKDKVDEVRHLIGTAGGWGGGPEESSMYLNVNPENNDGKTPYVLTVKDVPVDGFWSINVYNKAGYFQENEYGAYSLNNLTATPNADGSFTIHFGGDPKQKNFLYIFPGWNYTVRLYEPRKEIVDGTWKFPKAEPVK